MSTSQFNRGMVVVVILMGIALGLSIFLPRPVPDDPRLGFYRDSTAMLKRSTDSTAKVVSALNDSILKVQRQRDRAVIASLNLERKLEDVLDSARTVVNDSLATVFQLRVSLQRTIVVVAQYADTVRQERINTAILVRLQEVRTDSLNSIITKQSKTIATQDTTIKILDDKIDKIECKIFGRDCPSRVTVFSIGGVFGVLLMLVAR